MAPRKTTTATDPTKYLPRCLANELENASKKLFVDRLRPPLLKGSKETTAGRKNIETAQAIITPVATTLPNCWNGGESLKFMLMNPIAVVTLVRSTGEKFILKLSTKAESRSLPRLNSIKNVMNIWILSATARVIIITGALMIGVLKLYPYHPIIPMAPTIENMTTAPVIAVAKNDLSKIAMMRKITTNIGNITFPISDIADSENALFSMTTPALCISIPGNLASNSSSISLILLTTSGTSVISLRPGSVTVILIPVACPLSLMIRL